MDSDRRKELIGTVDAMDATHWMELAERSRDGHQMFTGSHSVRTETILKDAGCILY
jgi:hypothetical protein